MQRASFLLVFLFLLLACQSRDDLSNILDNYRQNSLVIYKHCSKLGYKAGTYEFERCIRQQEVYKIEQEFREKKASARHGTEEHEKMKAKEKEIDLMPHKNKVKN